MAARPGHAPVGARAIAEYRAEFRPSPDFPEPHEVLAVTVTWSRVARFRSYGRLAEAMR